MNTIYHLTVLRLPEINEEEEEIVNKDHLTQKTKTHGPPK